MTFSPEVRQVHQEHAESSEPIGNNSVVLEMLKAMRQEIQERDNQLKFQLQLRDEYMDAELKMRDHNLEEALKHRDEEWKSRWELREQELSEELKAREDAFLSYQLRRDSEKIKNYERKGKFHGEELAAEGGCFWVSVQGTSERNKNYDREKG